MPIYFKPSIQELPLSIDSIGNRWCQETVHRSKGFPLYHWLQTERGQGIIRLADKELLLNEGEGVLLSPDIPHIYRAAIDGWRTSFITFGGILSSDIHKICGEHSYLLVNAQEGEYFQNWIDRIICSIDEKNINGLHLSVQCYEFLIHLSDIYINNSSARHPLYLQYVEPTIEIIETHYADTLDVDTLASDIHITPQYLTRLFHRFTGHSVQSYITRYRVNKAKELLIRKPYLKTQSICHLVGYNDASYFTSVFKCQVGTTPKQFRRNYGIAKDIG